MFSVENMTFAGDERCTELLYVAWVESTEFILESLKFKFLKKNAVNALQR